MKTLHSFFSSLRARCSKQLLKKLLRLLLGTVLTVLLALAFYLLVILGAPQPQDAVSVQPMVTPTEIVSMQHG